MPSEFALIDRYFRRPTAHTRLGVGDDGALVRATPGTELVISTDMLVSGTHFLPDTDPEALGWKVLAVNVSDMAAMGAEPRWALLAAALPAATESWIERFARGFFDCAAAFGVDVVGGDTTRGPRNFCVTILGEVPEGRALLRSGGRAGDDVWVSGAPGLAALGLAHLQGGCPLSEAVRDECLTALHRPRPRVALGLALRGIASAAIDVSDGLLGDLGHILAASGVGAELDLAAMPAAALAAAPDPDLGRHCLLAGGDDYELLFTAPADRSPLIDALSGQLGLPLTRIGSLVADHPGESIVRDRDGRPVTLGRTGYDHFG
ncbi:MAG: thiamine-phosphate kinase [Rhodocyclaceae bacterium]|nr:thiamine-phosphate kinase [Rhodocyclaceae bacterium]